MLRFYLGLLSIQLFLSLSISAQDLVNSRKSSYYTFIYKINNKQAKNLYKDIWDIDTTYLHQLFDFYPTDSTYKKKLPLGHFVFIKTENGNLNCELKSVNNLNMNLLNNHSDLMMVFNDSLGNELSDVMVEVRSKKIPFHESIKAYRLRKSNKRGIISAEYQGHVSYFEIDRRFNNTFFVRTGRKISHTFPIKHIISPFFYIKDNVLNIIRGGRLRAPGIYYRVARIFKPKPHKGYIVFNKPKFRPDDTLRLKAFVTKRKGKPIRKSLDVFLTDYYPDPLQKKIGIVKPLSKGAYQFDFILVDSLNLKLDQTYTLELKDKRGHALLSSGFKYEEYELKSNKYSLRSEQKTKLHPATLYLKGEDSNEMPLFDVRVDVLIKPKDVKGYYKPKLFIPDTLWFYRTRLDPVGETKINIPDSIMPSASIKYDVFVAFYNAENERIVKTLQLENDTQPFPVKIELENDSLKVTYLDYKHPARNAVTFTSSDPNNNFIDKQITLPYAEKVNPFADWYSVSCLVDNKIKSEGFDMEEQPDNLQVLSNRTPDSLMIVTENPRKIPFRYFLFKSKNLILSSETESLLIKRKAKASESYTLSIQYIWAGKSETREYEINFDKRRLDIKFEHPEVIYPGQKANFKVTVQDAFGKPVENADLTAYAVTKKFDTYSAPSLPSFSKPKPGRAIFNEFQTKEPQLNVSKNINWTFWRKTLGLDSITFYKFLFPESGYFEHRVNAEVSQFSPFVIRHGNFLPVQIIYVDGQPVYYEGTSTLEPYSFHISPGEHTIDIRLNNSLVSIRNVKIEEKQKLIFSIDRNHLPINCSISEMPYRFSEEELKKLSRYFMVLRSQPRPPIAYIQQGSIYRMIGNRRNYYGYSSNDRLIGPFYPGEMTYAQKDGFESTFSYEPFFSYEFQQGLLKLKEVNIGNFMKGTLSWKSDLSSFKDQVQTLNSIQKYWQDIDENTPLTFHRFPDFEPVSGHIGGLTLDGLPNAASKLKTKAVFIVDLNNPDNYFIFSNGVQNLPFYPGNYQAVLVFNNEQYLKVDSIEIRPHGNNYYNLQSQVLHEQDTFSSQVMKTIKKWSVDGNYMMKNRQQELQKVRELYYQESSANYSFDHTVTGRIVSGDDGSPLPGVNVIVKGTSIGTVTDMGGYYQLSCPSNATLIFSFIGFVTEEAHVNYKGNLDMRLSSDVTQLDEVVVTAYGLSTERKNLSFSVATQLSGRVAGLSTPMSDGYLHGDSITLAIRGYTNVASNAEPLVILDGKIVRLQDIDKSRVTAMDVLKGAVATSLFGSRASNGVLLFSTKPGATKEELKEFSKSLITVAALENVPGNSIRKNFRDYAFWKPALKTNQDGHAEFEVVFPDDITGWNAYVLGMARKKTGQTTSPIRSYKPLIAQIAQPLFLIQGDSSSAIGKITNYTQEEIQLDRTIKINDNEISRSLLGIKDSKIDTIQLNANGDSLAVFYSVSHNDYTDGELRKLPVYPQGAKEASGYFVSLMNDTTITLNFENKPGKIKLYAQADLLDVLMDELDFLKNYQYECNEQLASRFLGLLLEKKICEYKKEKFKSEREILKLIRKLVGYQNADGSWGWWNTGGGSVWITLHVARSLDFAKKEGFNIAIDKESLINYLEINLANVISNDRLEIQTYLMEQGEKLQLKTLVDSIQKSKTAPLHDKLVAQSLIQLMGNTPEWDWINSQKSKTIKGNSYWGNERIDLTDNSIMNTLIVYKMVEKRNPKDSELINIRNYFLEQRKRYWRNTYESSLILEAILPKILNEGQPLSKPTLKLSGLVSKQIEKFPFEQSDLEGETLTISSSGQSPVYFAAYQKSWNTAPVRSDNDFVVSTYFDDDQKNLKTGKPVKLNVKVEVKNDAEYVMIEVPIPAGCPYESKPQSRSNSEVYREYYNHKTNIYCQYLKKGTYTYSIPLLPRYSGSYTINPAVIECMYFPVIYGREELKRVIVD